MDIEVMLQSTTDSAELIRAGISLSNRASDKINFISSLISVVEDDFGKVVERIWIQNVDSEDIMNEISDTKTLFNEVKDLIILHINEASKVDEKLEETINQLTILDENISSIKDPN